MAKMVIFHGYVSHNQMVPELCSVRPMVFERSLRSHRLAGFVEDSTVRQAAGLTVNGGCEKRCTVPKGQILEKSAAVQGGNSWSIVIVKAGAIKTSGEWSHWKCEEMIKAVHIL